ncbi:MAG: BamA/TamA family outer membrane protein [Ginsengibacter sp.]
MKIFEKIILLFVIAGITSCNVTKHVPEGDALYTGATITIKGNDVSRKMKHSLHDDLEKLTRPKPNSRVLGIPFKLLFYNLSGDTSKKKGFIRKFFRRLAEPPVLLSDLNLEHNNRVLRNYLENRGYFHAHVTSDTVVKRKKAHARYTAEPRNLYTIGEVVFPPDSSELNMAIKKTEPKTLLKKGPPFNLDLIKAERLRIDADLKEKGFYYFSPDFLLVNADSTVGNNKVNLYMTVKPNTSLLARHPYTINDVFVYSNYTLSTAAIDTVTSNAVLYKGYYVVDKAKMFKPNLFEHIMQFKTGDLYNRKAHNLALNRLINLGVYKFVKNRFELTGDSLNKLDTYYYLTPLPKKTLRGEVSGNTKSNNNVGSLVSFSFRNKNFLKGAELLAMNAYVGSEVQYSGSKQGFNTYKLGGEISVTVPKFVIPFFVFNTKGAYVPKSYIRLGYDLLNRRKLYTLNSFRGDLGYTWKPTERKEYKYNPISVNYVQPLNITQIYTDSIKFDPTLKKAIEKQFIIGSNATYSYDEIINDPKGKGWYVITNVDLSGNIVGIFARPNLRNGDTIKIFGAPYSQYVKGEADVRHYSRISAKSIWANRVDLGFGYPHGNSYELPFIKQFFIGGNNSIRAFRSRSLGPGTFRPANADNSNFYPDQSGDIKLEINSEIRQKLSGIVEGAIFVDAGNIWLYNDNPLKPGAKFTSDFLNQLAVGSGVGIRFDLQILLLRIDAAVPLRKPYLPAGQRWVFNEINFKNTVFNLAIGYPF